MDKNGTTFFRGVSFEEEEEEEEEEALFCSNNQRLFGKTTTAQPNQPNQREEERARARERERKRETTSFAVLVLPRFRKERKKASLSRDQITTISSESSFRLRNVGNISRDPVQKIIIIII